MVVQTGEEEEDTVFQVRCKLYHLSEENLWKERGTGLLKINVRKKDGRGARIGKDFNDRSASTSTDDINPAVMRKEAVYTLLLNVPLFKGMRVTLAQDPRYLRFSCIESGATSHYNLRVRMKLSDSWQTVDYFLSCSVGECESFSGTA